MQVHAQDAVLRFKNGLQSVAVPSLRMDDHRNIYKGRRYLILQFESTLSSPQRLAYERRGVHFHHWIPDHAYYVSMPADLDVTRISEGVPLLGQHSLETRHKLSNIVAEQRSDVCIVRVLFLNGTDTVEIKSILDQFGVKEAIVPFPGFPMVEICTGALDLFRLAAHPVVIWVDTPPGPDEALRYLAVKNERVEALYSESIDLSGEGITIGVGDAGKVGDHIDLNAHVMNYSPFPVHFHATHVSGIIAGRPNLNPLEGQGIAPHAKIVTAFFSQIIVDAERYMADYDVRITNNSYGSSQGNCTLSGDYNISSIFIDEQLTHHDSLMHVFSAGNDGNLTCTPYPQRFHTILNGWQSAKNTLVVGMLNHADVINSGSSRGPVDDGRIKPEIIAVGANRRSTQPNNVYAGGSGTSYSGPAIAGISALLYEAYQQEHGVSPDAALIKAILLNTADDLGQPGPDFSHGFGRVNARRAYEALIAETWFSGQADQDDQIDFMLEVPAGIAELRVMLLWKDPAAAPYSAPALVNDLGIQVTDPSAFVYHPWVLNPTPGGCTAAATRDVDDKNPQEQVTIANPTAGTYLLSVHGSEVPFGPQLYYLVYELIPDELLVVYPNGNESLVPGETEHIRWDAAGDAIGTFAVEYSLNNGASWTVINNAVASNLRRLSWVVPSNVTNQLRIRITAGSFQDVSDDAAQIIRLPTEFILTSPCQGYGQLSWTAATGSDHYAIYQLVDGWMQQIDTTSATSYLVGGLDPTVKEWFAIASVHQSGKQSRRVVAKSIFATGAPPCPWMHDLSIDALNAPTEGRAFTTSALGAAEEIIVSVRNAGNNTITDIPVSYRLDNGTIHTDTIAGPLSAGSTTPFTFQATADFSATGTYLLQVWVSYTGDVHNENDTLIHTIRHVANNPVALPWTEGFESADMSSVTTDQFAIPGIEFCDFEFIGGTGRMRTHAGGAFIADGIRALTLDAFEYGATSTNSLILTLNLAAYDTAIDDVRLTFSWMHHVLVPESDTMNRVWVRGSEVDPWIEILDFSSLPVLRGVHTELLQGLQITKTLRQHEQNFSSGFQLRFTQQGDASADSPIMEDGFTIDNLHLFKVSRDLRLLALTHPQQASCGLGHESIAVTVENTTSSTLSGIDVSYQVNGSSVITEQIESVDAGDTLIYHFEQIFDFSADTNYTINVWIHYPFDSYLQNDSLLSVVIHNSKSISAFPYLENFENGPGGWYADGVNASLEFGMPAGSLIAKAASGRYAWVTNLEGGHNDDEISYLISPCFDLTALTEPVLSFSHIYDTETDYDFHWVEYSTDGQTWQTLGTVNDGVHWYNTGSPQQSWEGTHGPWHVASIPMPPGQDRLQVRFVFTSDVAVTHEGFGVDDVHIHERHPVYHGADLLQESFPVNGDQWVYLHSSNKRVLGIHPMGQDLGTTVVDAYDSNPDHTADEQAWLLDRNWTIDPENAPEEPVKVRLFFTDSDFEDLLDESISIGDGCMDCIAIDDVYELEGWKYSGLNEDNTLVNNVSGISTYFPRENVQIVPYDSGYYAELTVASLSELWLTGLRIKYADSTSFKVSVSSDDAEEYWLTGSVNPVSTVLDIAESPDSQVVALRFRNVGIPRGSFIRNAWLQFTAAAADNGEAIMTIRAEDPYSSTSYTTRHFNVTARTYTTHRQKWEIDPWQAQQTGEAQRSTDLRVLVQEIVDHVSWMPGRDVAFIMTGNGTRRAWSNDGDADLAAQLVIEYDSVCHREDILYVDQAASGSGNGESWANAFTDLQHALDVAMRCPDAQEIWVRESIYTPTPFNTFAIASGIRVYGGFNGTETLRTQRDPVVNHTILSGDIGITADISDNSNHVVHILAGTDTTVVDGFTIRDGNAQGGVNTGGGILSEGNCMLRHLIISNCQATGGGSAISHRGMGKVLLISNTELLNNTGVVLQNEPGSTLKVDEGTVMIINE